MSEIAQETDLVQEIPESLRSAVRRYLLCLGDDALVLGHRLSEWCGHGPTLEEDIALANIALDLVGRSDALLRMAGQLEGEGRSEDDLAFFRDATEFRNAAIVELPRGDFAFTIIRQFLFDAYALPLYTHLAQNAVGSLAGIAAKAVKETTYHVRHTAEWVRRLGGGTSESRRRAQQALDEVWRYTGELFEEDPEVSGALAEAGWIPDTQLLRAAWTETVDGVLSEAGLVAPTVKHFFTGARTGRHTEHLGHLLSEMQIVARSHPGATW